MQVPKRVLMLGPVVLPLLVASGALGLVPGPRVAPREPLGQVCRSPRRWVPVLVLVEAPVSRQAVLLVAQEAHPVPVLPVLPVVVLLVVRRVLPLLRRRWVRRSPRLVSVP